MVKRRLPVGGLSRGSLFTTYSHHCSPQRRAFFLTQHLSPKIAKQEGWGVKKKGTETEARIVAA